MTKELKLVHSNLSRSAQKDKVAQQLTAMVKEFQIAKKTAGEKWPQIFETYKKLIEKTQAEKGCTVIEAIPIINDEIDMSVEFPHNELVKTYVIGAAVQMIGGE